MTHRISSFVRAAGAYFTVLLMTSSLFAASDDASNREEPERVALCRHNGSGTAVRINDDATINCPLAEGETTFILAVPHASALDRLTFVNANSAAQGKLSIAVADEELPPQSARWVPVDGTVSFHNKRRFNVSMVGIEAKFVRVTFTVQRAAAELNLALAPIESGNLRGWNAAALIAGLEP